MDYKERYGKNLKLLPSPYDERDYKFSDMVSVGQYKIPSEYETPGAGFTYDQGNSSMCCASAMSYIRFLQERSEEQSELDIPFCPSFIYANRFDDELFEGMYLSSACKKAREGFVLEGQMTYPNSLIEARKEFFAKKDELMDKAYPFRISSYYTCNSRKEIQIGIMQTGAVLIGVPVFDSFYTPDKNGIITYVKGQESNGGHAICLRGWKEIDGQFYWLIQNSWGSKWGNRGDGSAWLPAKYPWMDNAYVMLDYVTECKLEEYKKKYN